MYLDYQRIAFNAEAANGKSGEELLKEYGIEVIVMDGFEFTSGLALPSARRRLSDPKQTEWKLVYQDAQAVVYMRHPPPDVQPLNSFDALAGMEAQCNMYIEHDPGTPRCARSLGLSAGRRRWGAVKMMGRQFAPYPHATPRRPWRRGGTARHVPGARPGHAALRPECRNCSRASETLRRGDAIRAVQRVRDRRP